MVNLPADQLRNDETLPLLGRLVHRFGARGLRLTTRGESPAGAGIAGSSALNIAICGALARFTDQDLDPEALMDVAKDVEAQVIHVPTGLQDYRPAMRRHCGARTGGWPPGPRGPGCRPRRAATPTGPLLRW